MKVTVKDSELKDFLTITVEYELGKQQYTMHNDTWVDVVEALKAYWDKDNA